MTRTTIIHLALGLLMLALGAIASPASAKGIPVAYVTEASLKATCGKVGGDFVGGSGTGTKAQCSKPCGTGQCIVECDSAKKTCVGTTPPHQQRLADNQTVRDILNGGKKVAVSGEDDGADGQSDGQQPGSVLSGHGSDAGGGIGHIGNGNDDGGIGDFGWFASGTM